MNISILYATVEGQTEKIARYAADHLREQGHTVTLVSLRDGASSVDLDEADAVILAASVHERRHPEDFEVFVAGQRSALADKRTLFLSVSLSAAFPEGQEDAEDYVTEMEMRTRFKADRHALVAGAVKIGKYDYFAQQVVRFVVLRGRDVDIQKGENEFTDWDALSNTLDEFVAA